LLLQLQQLETEMRLRQSSSVPNIQTTSKHRKSMQPWRQPSPLLYKQLDFHQTQADLCQQQQHQQ
jgi:hypothetical protein